MNPCRNYGKFLLHSVRILAYGSGKLWGQFKHIAVATHPFLTDVGGDTVYVGDEIKVFDPGVEVVKIGVVGNVGDLTLAFQRVGFY